MKKAQFITESIDKANELVRNGWEIVDIKLEVQSNPIDIRGLTEYGVSRAESANKVVKRMILLTLDNPERHITARNSQDQNSCDGCYRCNYTGFIAM